VVTSENGNLSDSDAVAFGWQAVTPLEQLFSWNRFSGKLPAEMSLLSVDSGEVVAVAFKLAEDGNGYIARLWNTSRQPVSTRVKLGTIRVEKVIVTNAAEEDTDEFLHHGSDAFDIKIEKRGIATVRIIPQ
jgi:alpha-mannosidase